MEDIFLEKFHQASIDQCGSIDPEKTNHFIDQSSGENYTLVARPNEALKQTIHTLQEDLQTIDPHHFYYPLDRLHMTIVGGISISRPEDMLIAELSPLLENLTIQCRSWGTGSNISAASCSFYPVDFSMHELRERIRSAIGEHGTDYTIWIPEYEYVGWINFLRYQGKADLQVIEYIREHLEVDFGNFSFSNFELIRTSGLVLNPNWTRRIHLWSNS